MAGSDANPFQEDLTWNQTGYQCSPPQEDPFGYGQAYPRTVQGCGYPPWSYMPSGPVPGCQGQNQGRKRPRPSKVPSTSSYVGDFSEEDMINPFLSLREDV